ncbi:MAG TPA: hypothetical protein V6C85_17580 [Allocoleopsis sp.]
MLKALGKGISFRLTLSLTVATVIGMGLLLEKPEADRSGILKWLGTQPVAAQFAVPDNAAARVYQRLPNLPLENQYVSKETGKVDEKNTLVSRLMRYHISVKLRPPMYRLDWKLTLADYLGANENLWEVESQYPGASQLKQNPMESDRKAIESLTRAQREALVDTLVSIFNPNATTTPAAAPSNSEASPTAPNTSTTPSLPKPGDANLLLPQK